MRGQANIQPKYQAQASTTKLQHKQHKVNNRIAQPRHQFIINNRKQLNNLIDLLLIDGLEDSVARQVVNPRLVGEVLQGHQNWYR
jgi:hypothetical protein